MKTSCACYRSTFHSVHAQAIGLGVRVWDPRTAVPPQNLRIDRRAPERRKSRQIALLVGIATRADRRRLEQPFATVNLAILINSRTSR
jgi:hypothetical protein